MLSATQRASPVSTVVAVVLVASMPGSAASTGIQATDVVGGDGETWGYCGDLIALGGLLLGEVQCTFTIDVKETSLNKFVWWTSELEPIVKFNWSLKAQATAPGGVPRTFFQNWTGGPFTQVPGDVMIRPITLDRLGLWTFSAHYIPSDPTGTNAISPDTGWWDLKACVDPSPNENACIANTPNPSPI